MVEFKINLTQCSELRDYSGRRFKVIFSLNDVRDTTTSNRAIIKNLCLWEQDSEKRQSTISLYFNEERV